MDEVELRRSQRPRVDSGGNTPAVSRTHLSTGAGERHESILAKTMSSLTFEEHQMAIHDLHGVAEVLEDDPKMIDEKLCEMEAELIKISSQDAYLLAKETSPDYVCKNEFRLLFLRADLFNSKLAATRFVKFFALKLKLFGNDVLGRDIRLSDLGQDELDFMRSGSRWLTHRDRAGRAVCFFIPPCNKPSVETRFKVMMWSYFNTLRDKETQKRGMLLLFYIVGASGSLDAQQFYRIREFIQAVPTRIIGFHICYDNPKIHPMISLLIKAFDKFVTARCRSHYGSTNECIFALLTFGIPREAIPIDNEGRLQMDGVNERLKKRLEQEKLQRPQELLVFLPGLFDVLLGRRKLCQDHIGNLRYRHLILLYQEQYESAGKHEKTAIAESIVRKVHDNGGHFLIDYYADFIEVSDMIARKKVAHAFRSQRRMQNRKKENQTQPGTPNSPALLGSFEAAQQFETSG